MRRRCRQRIRSASALALARPGRVARDASLSNCPFSERAPIRLVILLPMQIALATANGASQPIKVSRNSSIIAAQVNSRFKSIA